MNQLVIPQNYLDRFKVFYPQTLFPPNWEALVEGRCPYCGNKLKHSSQRLISFCRGVKHAKSFVITDKVYNKILITR